MGEYEEKCCGDPQVDAVVDAAVVLANAGVALVDEGGIKAVVGAKAVCLAEQAAKAVGGELEDECEPCTDEAAAGAGDKCAGGEKATGECTTGAEKTECATTAAAT